jgi:hypothetical protein
MDARGKASLLNQLHTRRVSRNRHFSYFLRREPRAVLWGYRRLRSLVADLSKPGLEVRCEEVRDSGYYLLTLESAQLRYRRVTLLTPWEYEFLAREVGAEKLVPSSSVRGARPQ